MKPCAAAPPPTIVAASACLGREQERVRLGGEDRCHGSGLLADTRRRQRIDCVIYPENADFVVLADTEGNRFCIVDHSNQSGDRTAAGRLELHRHTRSHVAKGAGE